MLTKVKAFLLAPSNLLRQFESHLLFLYYCQQDVALEDASSGKVGYSKHWMHPLDSDAGGRLAHWAAASGWECGELLAQYVDL